MAPSTRSTSAIVEPDDVPADTGSSTVDTGSSATAAAATNMVTLTQAEYDAMQARIAEAQLTPHKSATQSAPGPAPTAAFGYRGKGPKPDKYYGGSRGKYNTFIEQCESNFILEGNNSDAGRVAYGAAFLAGTPSKVWKTHRKHNLLPTTWIEFKKVIYAELGDVTNIHRTLTEEYH